MLESYTHSESCFVTLTYDDEHLPPDRSIHKRDVQLFLKRFRKALEPRKIRYFAAGEYGEQTQRPHYHLILFGASLDFDGETVKSCWSNGLVHVGTCTAESIQYVAGYVVKKFIKKGDAREKEFCLMSRRPGIGYPALADIISIIDNPKYKEFFTVKDGVPDGLKHGTKFFPFGRFIKDKLRDALDRYPDMNDYIREMHSKYLEAKQSGKYNGNYLENVLLDESKQRNTQIERRYKIYTNRGKL